MCILILGHNAIIRARIIFRIVCGDVPLLLISKSVAFALINKEFGESQQSTRSYGDELVLEKIRVFYRYMSGWTCKY